MSEEWKALCADKELLPNQPRHVEVGTRTLAVLRDDTGVHVLDDVCPHAGASLSAGYVSEGCLVCPWHAWMFRVSDGKCPDNEEITVRRYAARVRDGQVEALLPARRLPT